MWRSQIPASKAVQKTVQPAADDDWETDPDFVNDVSEKDQRYGSKTVAGSGVVGSQNMTDLRQAVVQTDAEKKKHEYDQSARPVGYGGTYGVQTDRMDKSAVGNDYKAQVEKHASQKDYSQGFGGKYGVQTDRQDKSAETFAYKGATEKHASQKDYSHGFGGKYGVEADRKDASAEGYDYRAQVEKHASQKDYSTGFGGKFGVQQDRQDKSAVGWDHKEQVEKHSSQKDYSKGFGGKYGVDKDRQDKSAAGWERTDDDKPKSQPRPVAVPTGNVGEKSEEQSESASSIKAKFESLSKTKAEPPPAPAARAPPGKLNQRWQQPKPAEPEPADADAVETPPPPPTNGTNGHKVEAEAPLSPPQPHEQRQSNGHAVTVPPPALFADDDIPAEPVSVQQVEDLTDRFAEQTDIAFEEQQQPAADSIPEQQPEVVASSQEISNVTATAQFDYEPTAADELALVTGALVTNIQMVDEGWWYGTSNGISGLFPANYVELNQ